MKIRRASALDAPRLAEIESRQPMSAQWGEKGFASEVTHGASAVWCVQEDGAAQGFAAFRQAAGFGELLNLAVDPAYARRGFAFVLLKHALAELRSLGVQTVSLEVNYKNVAAIGLYLKLGFEEQGRRKKFYHGSDDALIMGITL